MIGIFSRQMVCTDLAVTPDCAGDGEEGGGGFEAGHGPAQPLVPHTEAESAAVHVEDHGEGVRHRPAVLTTQARGEVVAHLKNDTILLKMTKVFQDFSVS